MEILISVEKKVARQTNDISIVCGNTDYDVIFTFDSEWDAYQTKTARFVTDAGYQEVVFNGNICRAPQINNTISVKVGVYAGDLHTTTPAYVNCVKSILCGAAPHDEPSKDVYNQLVEMVNEIERNKADCIGDIVISNNADYAEIGEWADGNINSEDRLGYFVSIDNTTSGKTMVKATSTTDVRGVTVANPAFSGGCSSDKYDSTGALLKKYDYVAVMGLVSVIDNGTCTINGWCMPNDDGTAVPSTNNLGYQVIDRIDETHILIAVEPSADMLKRIKDDIVDLRDNKANTSDIPTKTSELENDSGFLTEHQPLKTINNQSIVGYGNINIQGGGGGGGSSNWSDIADKPFEGIDTNTLKVENGVMRVHTTDDAEQDNTKPITSSGVYVIVGNIDALLTQI